jgi:hypothetical protein
VFHFVFGRLAGFEGGFAVGYRAAISGELNPHLRLGGDEKGSWSLSSFSRLGGSGGASSDSGSGPSALDAHSRLGGDAKPSWNLPSHSRLGGDGDGASKSDGGPSASLDPHSRTQSPCAAITEYGLFLVRCAQVFEVSAFTYHAMRRMPGVVLLCGLRSGWRCDGDMEFGPTSKAGRI